MARPDTRTAEAVRKLTDPGSSCVYAIHMARINVYVPDDLMERARSADLNVSALTQRALADELDRRRTDVWLQSVSALASTRVSHNDAVRALDSGREGFDRD